MTRALWAGLVGVVLAVILAACGAGAGRGDEPSTRVSSMTTARATASAAAKLAQAQRTHEYPTPAPRQAVIGGWRSAVQAVQVFATTYVNWSAATVGARLRALAEVSVGQARSAMALAASQATRDYELQRGEISNSGAVEAIAPVLGHAHQYAVATREQTTAGNTDAYRGLVPAWHLALATVTQIRGGLWVLSAWQPEN